MTFPSTTATAHPPSAATLRTATCAVIPRTQRTSLTGHAWADTPPALALDLTMTTLMALLPVSVFSQRVEGAGIAQWLERQTGDRKVTGSNPCWSGRRIFFSRVNFLCWLLFWYPFHPRVTAVARKRPRSFCQKRRWQVTARHAYTLRMWLCMKWHGVWLYGVHRTCRDGSSFLWHQPCQCCKYTTGGYSKNAL